jgi:hypothetical protein
LAAIWPRTFDLGPDPRKFYEEMGASTRLVACVNRRARAIATIRIDGS